MPSGKMDGIENSDLRLYKKMDGLNSLATYLWQFLAIHVSRQRSDKKWSGRTEGRQRFVVTIDFGGGRTGIEA